MTEEVENQAIIKILKDKIEIFKRLEKLTELTDEEKKNYSATMELLNDLELNIHIEGGQVLKVGDKLQANWSDNITDHVTEGKVYEVVEVLNYAHNQIFEIVNDNGKTVMPISTTFKRVEMIDNETTFI